MAAKRLRARFAYFVAAHGVIAGVTHSAASFAGEGSPATVEVHLEQFQPVAFERPAFSSGHTRLEQMAVFARGDARVATFCTATELAAWSEDALPFVVGTAEGLFAKVAHSAEVPPLSRDGEHHGDIETVDYTGEEARGRMFITFAEVRGTSALLSCGVACTRAVDCEAIVSGATVKGSLRPKPPPSLAIRALEAAVHHFGITAGLFALLLAVFGVWAIGARKPRP